jgi:hypothetical protein
VGAFPGGAFEDPTTLKAPDSVVGGELLVTREQLVDLFQVCDKGNRMGDHYITHHAWLMRRQGRLEHQLRRVDI